MKKFIVFVATFLFAMVSFLPLGNATSVLGFWVSPTVQIIIPDNGLGDTNSALGVINYGGTIGGYNVNATAESTKIFFGSQIAPSMKLYSTVEASYPFSMQIYFGDDNYRYAGDLTYNMEGTIRNGYGIGSVSNSISDATNSDGLFLINTTYSINTFTNPIGSFSRTGSVSVDLTDSPVNEMLFLSVTYDLSRLGPDPQKVLFNNFEVMPATAPVPIPSTLLLMGSGLAGLVGIGRRRFKK